MSTSHKTEADARWFYASGKRKLGPFSFGQLRELARTGAIQPASMVWQEGTPKWMTAGSVPGLFAAVPVAIIPASLPPAPAQPYPQAIPVAALPSGERAQAPGDPTRPLWQQRGYLVTAIGLVAVLGLAGYAVVHQGTKPSPAKPEEPLQSPTPVLPAEYRTLAENLSLTIKSSPDQFRDNKSITEISAEGHGAVMALRGIQASDPDITYIATQGQAAYSEAIGRLERINALPKPPGAGELFVSSFIDGFFGNVFGGYARGIDAEDKQNAIIVEAQALVAALEKADAAHQLLPKVAAKYSAPSGNNNGRIVLDFDEAWGGWGPHDWLSIYNGGPSLQDCTISVELSGEQRQVRKNVHFVKNWPANSWMYARYEPGQEILGRRVGYMSVVRVQQLDVTVYSPQFTTTINYVYQGAVKDKKIAEKCKNLKLSGRYQPFLRGLVSETQPGVRLTLDGVPVLGKCRVEIAFKEKRDDLFGIEDQARRQTGLPDLQAKSWFWELDSWKKGEEKFFQRPKGQLAFNPMSFDMVISFPGTSYRHEVKLSRSIAPFGLNGERIDPDLLHPSLRK